MPGNSKENKRLKIQVSEDLHGENQKLKEPQNCGSKNYSENILIGTQVHNLSTVIIGFKGSEMDNGFASGY